MPRNVYSEINLHLTWHTKHDAPVLVDRVENRTHHSFGIVRCKRRG